MLTRAGNDEIERLQKALDRQPEFNVRISALLKAYGTSLPFFNVWHQDYDTVLARLDGNFLICPGENADFEEIAFFLTFNPYFRTLLGEKKAIKNVSLFLSGTKKQSCYDFMRYEKSFSVPSCGDGGALTIETSPPLTQVYSLTKSSETEGFAVGEFTPWYTDLSHRIRHGCARAYLLCQGGQAFSVLLVSAESEKAGLISGIATLPQKRGHGFAAKLLQKRAAIF